MAGAYGGCAVHADVISILETLEASLTDTTDSEAAALATRGSKALWDLRLAGAELLEVFAVIDRGLQGQMMVHMLKANDRVFVGVGNHPTRANQAGK